MRKTPFLLTASLASALLMASCASNRPAYVKPPRLALPSEATAPCTLPVMPDNATEADFEAVYALRGAALARCEGKRDLAVQTHLEEHRLIDAWLATLKPKPWWRKLWPG